MTHPPTRTPWVMLLLIVVLAFGAFALSYLKQPGIPTWNIGTGNDGDQYMNICVGMSRLHPFPWGLWKVDLGTVVGLWNCSLVIGLFAGAFLALWGFYPGLLYWVWTMIGLTSVFCLIPYIWQRRWGYSGLGGIIAGLLLATSPTIQQFVPQVMSDTLGMLLLGIGFLCLATLVIRERWRDVVVVSLWFAVLGMTRSSLLFQLPTLFAGLAVSWLASPSASFQRRQRLVKLLGVAALTIVFLGLLDVSLLAKIHGRSYVWLYTLNAFGWARLYGPMHQGSAVTMRGALWVFQHHAGWIWLAPVLLLIMGWGWVRRARWAQPLGLVCVPWLCYMILFLGRAGEPRHLLPWLLMEALMVATVFDGAHRALTARMSSRTREGFRLAIVILIGVMTTSAGRQLITEWRALLRQRAEGTAYLAWARPRLPADALIIASPEADLWWIARQTGRPVLGPSDPYHGTPLYVDPARLARHPFQPTRLTIPQPMTRAGLTYLMEYCERQGHSVWVLDPAADPSTALNGLRTTMPGTFGYQLVGYYHLQEAAVTPDPAARKLYRLVRDTMNGPSR